MQLTATAHDGTPVDLEVHGSGPALLCYNLDPTFPRDGRFAEMHAIREALVDSLADRMTLVFMSYPGVPKPGTLTPDTVSQDLLAIADAAGVDRFAWWGYSWGGVIGLQLAVRTERVIALAMTGFPPLDGPYAEILQLSKEVVEQQGSVYGVNLDEATRAQMAQYIGYYEDLQAFDDRAAVRSLAIPCLSFVGTADSVNIGDTTSDFGALMARTTPELRALGWEVHALEGKGHMDAMTREHVLPILVPWLERTVLGQP